MKTAMEAFGFPIEENRDTLSTIVKNKAKGTLVPERG